MTLLLNYKPVLSQPTGIGVYANAILPDLQCLSHILIPGGSPGSHVERITRFAWTQIHLPSVARRNRASLIFTPAPEGYLGQQTTPQVMMVHDLRPLSHPKLTLQSFYFKAWVPSLLRQAKHLLTNSNHTALEILRLTGINEQKLTVIPLGYDSSLYKPSQAAPNSHERPYILHVGQAYPHKNIGRLICAFALVRVQHPDLQLVLVGKSLGRESQRIVHLISQLQLDSHVLFKHYVPREELPALYQHAIAFVYPSLWEGFGLPILEAMACGTPVITSYGSGTEEIASNCAVLVNPYSINSIADAINMLVINPAMRARLHALGNKRVRAFSWKRTALATADLLSSLM